MLDAEGVTHVDAAGSDALAELVATFGDDGVQMRVARMKEPVLVRLRATGVEDAIGADRFHGSIRAAVDAATAE